MPKHATFMDVPFAQEWQDLFIWEKFFGDFEPRSFIELGTGHGGMSIFFALHCYQRGIPFHTFDNGNWFNMNNRLSDLVNIKASCHTIDIFSDEGTGQVANLIATLPKPLALFCDNGDKPREWSIFAPRLAPGDFCIVHDWGTEFTEENIGGVSVERILTSISDARNPGWKSMWFVRK